jgi:PHD/YefM family antitoxin component YafN of YafNO toxin-antitoxin module
MTTVTATYAKNKFSEILNKVSYSGERFLIQRQGKVVAILTSPEDCKTKGDSEIEYKNVLQKLASYRVHDSNIPKDLSVNMDKYLWDDTDD